MPKEFVHIFSPFHITW